MSQTFVAPDPDGFAVVCIADTCFDQDRAFNVGVYPTKTAAETSARRHRRADKAEQDAEDRRLAGCCRTCGRPR